MRKLTHITFYKTIYILFEKAGRNKHRWGETHSFTRGRVFHNKLKRGCKKRPFSGIIINQLKRVGGLITIKSL